MMSSPTVYSMSTLNCSNYPPVQPDPDIAGIGVLIGFVASAYLTLFCCLAKSYFEYKISISERIPHYHRLAFATEGTIQSLSDQQLVTGLSVLVGGFSQLKWGISCYHWEMVVNLAWFSTMTHIITLTSLRKQIRKNKALKLLRIVAMGILSTFLISAIGPLGYLVTETSLTTDYSLGYVPYEQSSPPSNYSDLLITFPVRRLTDYYTRDEYSLRDYTPWINGYSLPRPRILWPNYTLPDYQIPGYTIISSAYSSMPFPVALPAWCLYNPGLEWTDGNENILNKSYNWVYVALTISILLFGYISRVALLSDFSFASKFLRIPTGQPWRLMESILGRLEAASIGPRSTRIIYSFSYRLLRSVYAVFMAGNEILRSTVWEFTWLSFALMWGTIRIFTSRRPLGGSSSDTADTLENVSSQEKHWGFGQVVAIVIWILPAISFMAAYITNPEEIPKSTSEIQDITVEEPGLDILGSSSSPTLENHGQDQRQRLLAEPWYPKLKLLWYQFGLITAVDLLCFFPSGEADVMFSKESVLRSILAEYLNSIAFDIGLQWIFTLVFTEKSLKQRRPISYVLHPGPVWRRSLVLFGLLATSLIIHEVSYVALRYTGYSKYRYTREVHWLDMVLRARYFY